MNDDEINHVTKQQLHSVTCKLKIQVEPTCYITTQALSLIAKSNWKWHSHLFKKIAIWCGVFEIVVEGGMQDPE